jgi:hypothetical protein
VVVITMVVAVVGVSGFLLDQAGAKAPGVGAISGVRTGAWFCPHGGTPGGQGWVVIANPGTQDVVVRATTFGKNGVRARSSFGVPARHQVYREVPATESGASTEVEYFGGWVGAASVIQGRRSTPGLAGEACVPTARRVWFLPDQPTGRGETSNAVVMNPFTTPAQFDVVIRTERRSITPQALDPFVLAPRTSVAIPLNKYALEAPGETTVITQVIQRTGRVVAGSLAAGDGSLRAEAGVSLLERRWSLPGTDLAGSGDLSMVNPGGERSDVNVIRQGLTLQEVLTGEDGVTVAGGKVLTYAVKNLKEAGLTVESTGRGRIATALILAGPGADSATVDGVSSPEAEWLVVPTTPPKGGKQVLILLNPGRAPVDVSIRVLGETGFLDLPGTGRRTVPAGRTLILPLQTSSGPGVSAVVTADRGTLVAAGASMVGNGTGYAVTLGLPMTTETTDAER